MIDELEEEEKRLNEDMEQKYLNLKISPEKEEELRNKYIESVHLDHKNHYNRFTGTKAESFREFIAKAQSQKKDLKRHHAYLVYVITQEYPEASVSKLCYSWNLSQGYFRELRQLNATKWKEQRLDEKERDFHYIVLEANNLIQSADDFNGFWGDDFKKTDYIL